MLFRIRPAADDIAALGALKFKASLAWGDHVAEITALPEARRFRADHLDFAFVAEDADRIVGFAALLPAKGRRAELEDLFVDPALWRRGIGRLLIAEAERRARSRGARSIHVIANGRAQGFYSRCGFELIGEVATCFGPAPEMEKRLD